MPVIGLGMHGDAETNTQRSNKVLGLFTIVCEGVSQLDLFAALPEMKAYRKRQPVALAVAVGAVDSDDGIHQTLPFYAYLINM